MLLSAVTSRQFVEIHSRQQAFYSCNNDNDDCDDDDDEDDDNDDYVNDVDDDEVSKACISRRLYT